MLKKKDLATKNPKLAKISFRNEGEKTFSVEKKTKRLCPKLTSPRGMARESSPHRKNK